LDVEIARLQRGNGISFYMARRELTVKEFRAFVNDTGYQTDADRSGGGLIIERRGGV
jgi:formylglycine-generating enzyme required for sulfatase activity